MATLTSLEDLERVAETARTVRRQRRRREALVLNGVRGLIAPWFGSLLFLLVGPAALAAAAACSVLSFPFLLRLRSIERVTPGI